MAEKGFGTRVAIRADEGSGLEEADLEAVLDRLAEPQQAAVRQRPDQPRKREQTSAAPAPRENRLEALSKHLTFANAISCIALFVALSGAAYAAKTTLGNKAVKTRNLANGSVTTLKLRGGAVTNLKLRNGAVTGAKIAPGTIGASQLANGSIRSAQLGGSVVTTGKLKDGAVSESKILNSAVTNSKLGANAVTSGKIQDGAVTSAKLSASFLAQLVKNVTYVTKTSPDSDTTEKSKSVDRRLPGRQAGDRRRRPHRRQLRPKSRSPNRRRPSAANKRTGWSAGREGHSRDRGHELGGRGLRDLRRTLSPRSGLSR